LSGGGGEPHEEKRGGGKPRGGGEMRVSFLRGAPPPPPVTKIRSLEHPKAVRGRPGSDANQCMLQYQHNTPKIPHRIILSSRDLIKRRIFLKAKITHGKKELGEEPGF